MDNEPPIQPEQNIPPLEAEGVLTEQLDIQEESSKVSSSPGKNLAIIVAMLIASTVLIYFTLFKKDPELTETQQQQELVEDLPAPSENIKDLTTDNNDNTGTIATIAPIDIPEEDDPIQDNDISTDAITPTINPTPNNTLDFPDPAIPTFEADDQDTPPDLFTEQTPPDTPIEPIQSEPAPPALPQPPEANNEPALPTAPTPPGGNIPTPEEAASNQQQAIEQQNARRAAGMVVRSGPGPKTSDSTVTGKPNKTSAQQTEATYIGELDTLIAQGKMIDAILETAINTDLPGSLRAITSRDVYAEAGKNILIPKGSRLTGKYQASVQRGQRRVYIIWDRIIRPDGIDIAIESSVTDQLGHSGLDGEVNNRYFEVFGNAILMSSLSVLGVFGLEKLTNSTSDVSSTSTSTTDGVQGNSEEGSPTALAIQKAAEDFSTTVQGVMGDLIKLEPTITVNQGQRIKVYVNKDLIFPKSTIAKFKLVN